MRRLCAILLLVAVSSGSMALAREKKEHLQSEGTSHEIASFNYMEQSGDITVMVYSYPAYWRKKEAFFPLLVTVGVASRKGEKPLHVMLDNFVSYVKGYFDDNGGERYGGMEIQFNITPYEDFINAVEHPDDYPELLVRVSGYTAYFRDLTPQMQKEIIDRTEYLLSTGSAVQHPSFQISPRR